MPIEITCSECSKRLRVPDKVAGKRVKCPKCGAVVRVPELEAAPPEAAPAETPPTTTETNHSWWLKTEDGEQYGPIPKTELDEWYAEGRVTADSQLLPDGADQWQWASDVYPELDASDSAPPAPAPPAPVIPSPVVKTPVVKAPVGPVAVSDPVPSVDAAPGAFDFAAADTSATARVRGGRRRVRKVVTKRPASATAAAGPVVTADPGELSDKSKVVAGLLGIFLGAYGVHRFYLGYTGLGLCMLFTCGGCGIWSLIDAILVFAGSVPDAQGRPLQ